LDYNNAARVVLGAVSTAQIPEFFPAGMPA